MAGQEGAHAGTPAETYVQRMQRQLVASTQLCNKLLHEQMSMAQLLSTAVNGEQTPQPREHMFAGAASNDASSPGRYYMPPWPYPYWYPPPPWMAPGAGMYPPFPGMPYQAMPSRPDPSAQSASLPPTAAFDRAMNDSSRSAGSASVAFPFSSSSMPPVFTGSSHGPTLTSAAVSSARDGQEPKWSSGLVNMSGQGTASFALAEERERLRTQMSGMTGTEAAAVAASNPTDKGMSGSDDDQEDLLLFDALRDAIYSEVATLISMNEDRPSWLVDIFREMQLLTEDNLRQQALSAVQNIISEYWARNADQLQSEQKRLDLPEAWALNAEQTPSESMHSTESDFEPSAKRAGHQIRHGRYDYIESVESASSLSTPTNASSSDVPFARDSLGSTAISLDREVEHLRTLELGTTGQSGTSSFNLGQHRVVASGQLPKGDVDTEVLDRQVRVMMMKLMPILKQNIEKALTAEIVVRLRNVVVEEMRSQSEITPLAEGWQQLENAVHNTLSKFVGQTFSDCGENLLLETSEVLFNELTKALRQSAQPSRTSELQSEAGAAEPKGAAATGSTTTTSGEAGEADQENPRSTEAGHNAEEDHSKKSSQVQDDEDKSREPSDDGQDGSRSSDGSQSWIVVSPDKDKAGSDRETIADEPAAQDNKAAGEGEDNSFKADETLTADKEEAVTLEDLPEKLDSTAASSQGDKGTCSSLELIVATIEPPELAGDAKDIAPPPQSQPDESGKNDVK